MRQQRDAACRQGTPDSPLSLGDKAPAPHSVTFPSRSHMHRIQVVLAPSQNAKRLRLLRNLRPSRPPWPCAALCSARLWPFGCVTPAAAEAAHAIAMLGSPAMPRAILPQPRMSIPTPQRGAGWCKACLGHSTASTRSSSKVSPVQGTRGYVVESLMARGYDEPFTLYGLLARTIETDDARSYVTFSLDPAAHFSDGAPVTAGRRRVFLATPARPRPA